MKQRLVFLFSIFLTVASQAQHAIGIGFGSVQDYDLGLAYGSLSETLPRISNRYSGLMEINYEYKSKWNVSVVFAPRIVMRKINYLKFSSVIGNFTHQAFELPLAIRYCKPFKERYLFSVDVGGGVNYVLTNDERSKTQVTDFYTNQLQFVSSKKPTYFLQARINLEIPFSVKSSVLFFVGYQYQFQPLFYLKETTIVNGQTFFERRGAEVNNNYWSFGINYRFKMGK